MRAFQLVNRKRKSRQARVAIFIMKTVPNSMFLEIYILHVKVYFEQQETHLLQIFQQLLVKIELNMRAFKMVNRSANPDKHALQFCYKNHPKLSVFFCICILHIKDNIFAHFPNFF